MSNRETQTVDDRARVTLPKGFAKATVILEEISDVEVRIRKTNGVAAAEQEFPEETVTSLSDRDRDRFLELIENTPPPNAALRSAMSRHRDQHG